MSDVVIELLKEKKPIIDSLIKKYIPESFDESYLEYLLGKPRYAYNLEATNKAIAEPIWEFLNRGGKRWRPVLFLLIGEALGGDIEKIKDFAIIPEIVHNGTLIIDDIEDRGELRRGIPCSHKIFGIDIALNAGNTMYYLPLITLIKNKDKIDKETLIRVYETYVQEMINVSFGQGMDIWWHSGKGNADNVTEEEYLQMCAYKTGCLARMSARLAVALVGGSEDIEEKIGKIAESIGVAFQIQDDILDISSPEELGKDFGNDIREGKRSLLVVHTLKVASKDDRDRLIEILKIHTSDPKLIKEAIDILEKYDSVEYARKLAKKLVKDAWEEVDPLLEESEAKEKLKAFADFLVNRKF